MQPVPSKFFVWSLAGLFTTTLIASACKKKPDATTQATSAAHTVSAFVTREYGYIDTEIGRRHVVAMAGRIGIKRLFVDMWSRGCTLYKSDVMKQYGGPAVCDIAQGDPLADLIRYGKEFKVEIVPWFEWGNILPAKSALWQRNKNLGWEGFPENFHTVPSVRINPYKGSFESFMAALLKEVVVRYGSREIHICDNFAPHLQQGEAARVIKGPKTFTAFMDRVTTPAIKAGATFSLSSQRHLNSLHEFSIDWSLWIKKGIVRWVYPQLYHVLEGKNDQFNREARSERNAGAIGVALYSGPLKDRWSLAGLGRSIKMAKAIGLESVLFDLNSLLKDQQAFKNEHVLAIANALGTTPRLDLGGGAGASAEKPPPAPVLPPPDSMVPPRAPDLPPPQADVSQNTSSGDEETPTPPSTPITKTKLCEYMKVSGAPEGGIPTYASASKGEIIEYVGNDNLVYRYLTQTGIDGELMMYIQIQTGAAQGRIRWVQAKYLVERRPDVLTCEP